MSKIIKASITPQKVGPIFFGNAVDVEFEDGTTKRLFEYYPDEIRFAPSEFINLTEREAIALRNKRDMEWLRS